MGIKNKVKFNIKNVHFAKKKEDGTYDVPIKLPGAVSISLEAQGELEPFYADGVKYYVSSSNGGYEGDLEMALITDEIRQEILNEKLDEKGVMIENAYSGTAEFALGFDIDGDAMTTRFWFYNCSATRPSTESSTTEDTKEPTTDTITVSCAGDESGNIRSKTTDDTPVDVFDAWYEEVYLPGKTDIPADNAIVGRAKVGDAKAEKEG